MTADCIDRRISRALCLAHSGEAESILAAAREILAVRIKYGDVLGSPGAVRDYLRLLLCDREHEAFVVMLLDAQNRVLAIEEMFRGTLTQTSVYPREIVKVALRHNAASVIFAHNHPSGIAAARVSCSAPAGRRLCGKTPARESSAHHPAS